MNKKIWCLLLSFLLVTACSESKDGTPADGNNTAGGSENTQNTGNTEGPGNTQNPGNTEGPGNTQNPGNTVGPGNTQNPGNTEGPGNTEASGNDTPAETKECDPSAYQPSCNENSAITCGSDGKYITTQCKGLCVGGSCKCDAGFKAVCDGSYLINCSANGEYQKTKCDKTCIGGKCADGYTASDIAPSLASADMKAHLGSEIIDGGVNFAIYSEHASRIELLLFDSASADTPSLRVPLKKNNSNIWTAFISGIGDGQHYGYIAFGPNWPYDPAFTPGSAIGFISDYDNAGNRYNPNKLLIDPYAKRLSGDMNWALGDPTTGKSRNISTWGAAPKSMVAKSLYQWSDSEKTWRENRQKGDAFKNHAVNDLIYYEVNPKGLTKNAASLKALGINIDVKSPGTWRGIGEIAPYLKDLGINVLELMPVAEKQDSDTYWGYNTINYFSPDINLSFDARSSQNSGVVIDEFKWMVDQLHQNDIEIVIDVVYGQTGEGGISADAQKTPLPCQDANWAGFYYDYHPEKTALLSFRGIDNSAYYLLEDFYYKEGNACTEKSIKNASYVNQTGVGNQTRANDGPFKQLILDNMHYWVEEMHIDGFRVDLASVLGVPENDKYGDTVAWFKSAHNTVVQTIIDDPILQKYHTRIVAEPWDASRYALGGFPKATNKQGYAWSEWNGRFRDLIRRFVNDDDIKLDTNDTIPPNWENSMNLGNLFTGSSVLFGDDGRAPYNSINYITAHDGFTLYDLVSYDGKSNGCGKLNMFCCEPANADLPQCIFTGGSDNNDSRNWCKLGYSDDNAHRNENSRCDSNDNEALKRQMMRNLLTLLLMSNGTPMIYGGDEMMRTLFGHNNTYGADADNEYNWLRWNDLMNHDEARRMHDFVKNVIRIRKNFKSAVSQTNYQYENLSWKSPEAGDANWSSKSIGLYYKQTGSTPGLYIMINMESAEERTFNLPESGEWNVLIDTQGYFDHAMFNDKPDSDTRKTYNASESGLYKTSDTYTAKPRSIVVISK